jgi:hypothetical protein
MKVAPVVREARNRVAEFRLRLQQLDFEWDLDRPVDLEELASLFLFCDVVTLPGLSARAASRHVMRQIGIPDDKSKEDPAPLVGGLYVGARGMPRWIFLEGNDSPERRRFTLAHEIGHLVNEVEPAAAEALARGGSLFVGEEVSGVRRYSRCPEGALDLGPSGIGGKRRWSEQDILEIEANHFAAELLMPIEGVTRIIQKAHGIWGVRSDAELEDLISRVASRFKVTRSCARRHLTKDLGIVPATESPNTDLFVDLD